MYILLSGTPPFDAADDKDLVKLIKKGKYSMEGDAWSAISDGAKDLIQKLLIKDKTLRLSASQAYMHSWCREHHKIEEDHEGITSAVSKIKRFHTVSKLKQAVQTFIISQIMKPKELKAHEQAFSSMDINGDGVISKEELYIHLKETMAEEDAKNEAERIIALVDTDNNGVIDYTEFLRATVEKRKMITKANLTKTFQIFDKDNSGSIEANELKEWLSGGGQIKEGQAQEFMNEFEINSDGKIYLKQFEDYLYTFTNESFTDY